MCHSCDAFHAYSSRLTRSEEIASSYRLTFRLPSDRPRIHLAQVRRPVRRTARTRRKTPLSAGRVLLEFQKSCLGRLTFKSPLSPSKLSGAHKAAPTCLWNSSSDAQSDSGGERIQHLSIEHRYIVGHPAGRKLTVLDHILIDPFATSVTNVCLQRRP